MLITIGIKCIFFIMMNLLCVVNSQQNETIDDSSLIQRKYNLKSCTNATNCTSPGRDSGHGKKHRKLLRERYPESLFKVVYWEVKPYAFRNKNGKMDGVYPTIFKNAMYYCGMERNATVFHLYNASKLVEWEEFRKKSRRDFLKTFKSNSYPDGLIPGRDIYLPAIFRVTKEIVDIEKKKRFMNFDIAKASNLAIIVHRDYISLPYKIFRGIKSCGQIFFITALMTIFFGVLIWLSERVSNPAFPSSCFVGTGTGVWWSFVSMTTVGYGDVVPNSIIGRFIAAVWVCVGVMIACIVTATVTEVVNGVGDLNIANRDVAVLEDSFEAERVETDFRGKLVQFSTYEEVFEAVREGKVFAAAVNAEVAAWNIEEIQDDNHKNPLRIVRLLPADLNLNMVFSKHIPEDFKLIIRCMRHYPTEVYGRAKTKFARYCPTETLYIESVFNLFKSAFVQVLLGAVFLLIFIGITVDLLHRHRAKKKDIDSDDTEMMVNDQVITKTNGHV